jgi:hypothetical protein
MTARHRSALVALAVTVFIGLGLTTGATAHAQSTPHRSGPVATPTVRAAGGSTAQTERRSQLDRVGPLLGIHSTAAGWARILPSETITTGDVDVPSCCQSRAPPT